MLQDKIPIPTDHFFKFLAISGLVATIYCASFPLIFITPYNDKIDEHNLLVADLKAKEGYLLGTIRDLKGYIPDSLEKNQIFYFLNLGDVSDTCYYINLTVDSSLNRHIKELNKNYFELARTRFSSGVMHVSMDVDSKNLKIHEILTYLCGFLAFGLTIWGMFLWYRYQKKLDGYQMKVDNHQRLLIRKLELEIKALEKNNENTIL